MSLNLTPTASGEIQTLGESESPALLPAGTPEQPGTELQHSCWELPGTAGGQRLLIVRDRLGTAGALPSLLTRIKTRNV